MLTGSAVGLDCPQHSRTSCELAHTVHKSVRAGKSGQLDLAKQLFFFDDVGMWPEGGTERQTMTACYMCNVSPLASEALQRNHMPHNKSRSNIPTVSPSV